MENRVTPALCGQKRSGKAETRWETEEQRHHPWCRGVDLRSRSSAGAGRAVLDLRGSAKGPGWGAKRLTAKQQGGEQRGAVCKRGLLFVNICINDLSARAPSMLMKLAVDIKLQGVMNIVEGKEIISKDAVEVEPGLKIPGKANEEAVGEIKLVGGGGRAGKSWGEGREQGRGAVPRPPAPAGEVASPLFSKDEFF